MIGRPKYRIPGGVDIHELRTFGDLPDSTAAYIQCRDCGRLRRLDRSAIVQWLGRPLYDLRARSRCIACGSKRAQLLLHDQTASSDRAWFPRPPMLTR